jgi:hypothetical protein
MSTEKLSYVDEINAYVSSKPTAKLLQAGKFLVMLASYFFTNSRLKDSKGTEKDNIPEYVDVTPQVGFTVKGVNGEGVLTDRLNFKGYRKFKELSEEERAGKFMFNADKTKKIAIEAVGKEGYVCYKNKEGKLVRVEDPEKTAKAKQRIDSLLYAMQIPEGSGIEEGFEGAIDGQIAFEVTVVNNPYEGKEHLEIRSFRKVEVEA